MRPVGRSSQQHLSVGRAAPACLVLAKEVTLPESLLPLIGQLSGWKAGWGLQQRHSDEEQKADGC